MAYMGYCEECHHMNATVVEIHLQEYFLDHSMKSHNGENRFVIFRISPKEYQEFLENKDNAAFWEAWRLAKKM